MTSKLQEAFALAWLNIVVKKRNFVEYLRVIKRYYRDPLFRQIDSSLLKKYFFKSPFNLSKEFLQKRGESDLYTYGETPLTTWELIARKASLQEKDRLFELGCGRGRGCFWLHQFIGCKVVGVDYVPAFIQKAAAVKQQFLLEGIEFCLEDILKVDLSGATAIYLYGLCYEDEFLRKLTARLVKLSKGTKIITVSYPISDYAESPILATKLSFIASYTWGEAEVFVQELL